MKKTIITHLDLELYTETLDNGLEIYIVPNTKIHDIYVTYTTKYGSNIVNFKNNGKKYNVPYGIAHFLEHKMFEQKDGSSPFEEFDKLGASANAYTNNFQTTYLWSCPDNFEKNMKILLNYVNNPYFTDENVEKEKGIIIEELKMYEDSPFRKGLQKIKENALIKHPSRIDVGGTIKSVKSIKKEDLYNCYDTFYNPNNMFIVITGNIDPNNVVKIIKKHFHKKNTNNKIEIEKYNEPLRINCKKEVINMNVTIPKFLMGIKIDMNSYPISKKEWSQYLSIYLDSLIGPTAKISDELRNQKIITENFDFFLERIDNYILITIAVESKHPTKLEKILKNEFNKVINEETFNRKKKCYLSSTIKLTDNIYGINRLIMREIIHYDKFNTDHYNQIKNLNYKEFNKLIKHINFNNNTILYIKPLKEK